ncbi:MAG TPA: hypothetical protein VM513_23850 [Kofleriaceae bacterium]|nr:hypothetical protein [Kofleriaceae bacterium]
MKVAPLVAFALFAGCGPEPSGDDTSAPASVDADGDTISDRDEGAAAQTDTDRDGTPDFLDEDSDDDGILDLREAGDADLTTLPLDSDNDGTADFRDLDSDANGRTDAVDGTEDIDSDSVANYADADDDGDWIDDVVELGPVPASPLDSDSDGTPDFRDADSDDDTIRDAYEGATDYDGDHLANYLDDDSDGDCVSDRLEARGAPPADNDGDAHADFLDRDSDNDGIPDGAEDANCSGAVEPGETDGTSDDTDGDGTSDLVETAAGSDPVDPASNPQANGDFVFVMPYQGVQAPLSSDLDFSTSLKAVDLYVMLDRSGSMATEISAVKANLATVVNNVACPPLGAGAPGDCIPDLWAGAGTIGYHDSGAAAFQNWVDVQPNPSFANLPTSEPSSLYYQEPLSFAGLAAVTGEGGDSYGVFGVPARVSCAGSPAANAGYATFGYPCFRQGALPVVILATDEAPLEPTAQTFKAPAWATVVKPAFVAAGAKLVGVLGSSYGVNTDWNLRTMAADTGAVDAMNGNAPLVFDGAGANAAAAIQTGIVRLANGLPLDLSATSTDDPGDAVDAVAAFVDHLETRQLGTAQCAGGLDAEDTNGDAYADTYRAVRTGTPVCWRLVSKPNTTVPAIDAPQLYRATVIVRGDGVTQLDQRDVFFLVPPRPADPPIL